MPVTTPGRWISVAPDELAELPETAAMVDLDDLVPDADQLAALLANLPDEDAGTCRAAPQHPPRRPGCRALRKGYTCCPSAVPGLFVNARTDTYWLGDGDETETLRRLDLYQQAGADGVFVPGLTEPGTIAALVKHLDVPLNVLCSPAGPTVPRLAGLGVRRISLGSLLYRRALAAAVETMTAVAAGRTPRDAAFSYEEVQELSRPAREAVRPDGGAGEAGEVTGPGGPRGRRW
ncbi:hypothetical protein STXM2123_4489 [Streptomyces sp. F-3]|uniref:isocitrate lyase/phosphoenolpyruvate mutase family protein n=1 Tax=Streptomyces sp. F-3 TaxID=1840095 RepID=UPI0007C26498|nr:hypothetical protein STXM2123_4489 [Streptomyces sp. F-3]